jgi:hypothetical protein
MRALTIDERVDRITECISHRSTEVTYRQCDQKAKYGCRDSLRCSRCNVSEVDLSCGESWSDGSGWEAHSDWSDR